jgi:fatty acid desaturase
MHRKEAGECHIGARTTRKDTVRELQRTLYRAASRLPDHSLRMFRRMGILVVPALIVGFVAGFWIRRWRLVAAVTVIGVAASLVSWQTDWVASGGLAADVAILFAWSVWIPLVLGAVWGVSAGLEDQHRRQH